MTAARLMGHFRRADGNSDTFWALSVPMKCKPLPHHVAGLSWTATGYGARIPTRYMVQLNGKWRRVYCRTFSNAGTCFIGPWRDVGERIIVDYMTGA